MAKVFLRAGKVGLVTIVPLVILGIVLFGLNYFSVVQADPQDAGDTIPLEVKQLTDAVATHIAAKQYDLAEQNYLDIVDTFPGTEYATDALGEVGFFYARQSDDASVATVIDQLYAQYSTQPTVAKAIDRIAQGYISKGDIAAAQMLYIEAISQMPDHANVLWLHTGVIKCQIAQKDFQQAQHSIEALKNTYSEHPELCENIYSLVKPYRRLKRFNEVRDLYQYASLNSSDGDLAVMCQTRVVGCEIRLGNYDAADQAVEDLLNGFSRHKELCVNLYTLANKYWALDRYGKAKNLYEYISQNSSDSTLVIKGQTGVVGCQIQSGNFSAADQAIEVLYGYSDHDDFVIAVNKLSKWLRETDQSDKAIAVIENYIAAKPSAYNNFGLRREMVLNDVAIGDFANVEGFIGDFMQTLSDSGLIVDPNLPVDTVADPNNPAVAASAPDGTDTFRQIFPVFEAIYAEGSRQLRNGRPGLAKQYFKRSIKLGKLIDEKLYSPRKNYLSAEVCLMIAEGYRHDGQYARAITYLEKAIIKWPGNKYTSQAKFVLKDCYKRLGTARR